MAKKIQIRLRIKGKAYCLISMDNIPSERMKTLDIAPAYVLDGCFNDIDCMLGIRDFLKRVDPVVPLRLTTPQQAIERVKELSAGPEYFLVRSEEVESWIPAKPKTSPSACIANKTLCDALRELAAIERAKGTEKFVKDIIDRSRLLRGTLEINHNPITGGGDPNDANIEDTEFKDPRLPFYIDIEYVEVGYAMTKQLIPAGLAYGAWVALKPLGRILEGSKPRNPISDYNNHTNRMGNNLGRIIATYYEDLTDFTNKFGMNECTGAEDAHLKLLNRHL